MACQLLAECPIFAGTLQRPAMRVWRDLYCESSAGFAHCKRLELRLRGVTPDQDLLPNGQRIGEVVGSS
jgi:hypothetical protein